MTSVKPSAMPERFTPDFLARMDGRCRVARVLRQRLRHLVADLGGDDALSYQQRSLCLRAIHLEARIEGMETLLASGRPVDVGQWVQAVNALQGVFKALGLKRIARTVDLQTYLEGRK